MLMLVAYVVLMALSLRLKLISSPRGMNATSFEIPSPCAHRVKPFEGVRYLFIKVSTIQSRWNVNNRQNQTMLGKYVR